MVIETAKNYFRITGVVMVCIKRKINLIIDIKIVMVGYYIFDRS